MSDSPPPSHHDPRSVLGQLALRAAKIRASRFFDIPVPGWSNPEIVIRCSPVDPKYVEKALDKVNRAHGDKKAETRISEHAGILVEGCVGVIAKLDGVEYSLRPGDPEGEPTTFDDDLAENLGLDPATATNRSVCRALFFAEGDILSCANALAEWSGLRQADGEEVISGE